MSTKLRVRGNLPALWEMGLRYFKSHPGQAICKEKAVIALSALQGVYSFMDKEFFKNFQ